MWNVFNHILTVLCLVDLVVIFSNLSIALRTLNPTLISHTTVHWSDCICHIAVSCSVFLTISITIERYLAVFSPIEYQARVSKLSQSLTLTAYLLPAFVCAAVFNIPKILNIVGILTEESFGPDSREIYFKVAISSQIIHPLCTTCIIPMVILTLFNCRIAKGAKRMNSCTLDSSLQRITASLVVVFVILNIPKVALLLYEISTLPNILECHRRSCLYQIHDIMYILINSDCVLQV